MSCPETQERLDDYVDGSLPEADFQEVELHLHACLACREEERLLRSLLAQAASLSRELVPSRDLWPGIAERLEARSVMGGRVRMFFLSPATLAAAAVLLALLATLRRPPTDGPKPSLGQAHYVSTLEPSLARAEGEYVRATDSLKAALEARRGSLSPETLRTVDQDLRVIDTALDSLRGALEKEPGNEELSRLLISTHRRKLDVLRNVTRLSNTL